MKKICTKCKIEKDETEFSKNAKAKDGRQSWCKYCTKIYLRKLREGNPGKVKVYTRKYREKHRDEYLAKHKIETRVYYAQHPEAKKAHTAVRRAIKRGQLKKGPCQECGKKNAQAHHEDYEKPLEVIWLCARCHKLHHLKMVDS